MASLNPGQEVFGYLIAPENSAKTESGTVRFSLQESIGSGAMGTVWKSVILEGIDYPSQFVAVKFLKQAAATDPSIPPSSSTNLIARFQREQVLMSRVQRHPCFIDYVCGGRTTDDRLFFVTEYHPGQTLDAFTQEACREKHVLYTYSDSIGNRCTRFYGTEEIAKPHLSQPLMPLDFALTVVMAVLEGLEALHTMGLEDAPDCVVTHRDMKSGNIMLCIKDGRPTRVKILDFGIAKVANYRDAGFQTLTSEQTIVGTMYCMAPEQIRTIGVGPWSDVFAVGIVLLEMLAGVRPGASLEDVRQVCLRTLTNECYDPGTYADGIPQSIRDIVKKATRNESAKRYQHAGEMLADVRNAIVELYGSSFLPRIEQTLYGIERKQTPVSPRVEPILVPPSTNAKWSVHVPGNSPPPHAANRLSWRGLAIWALLFLCTGLVATYLLQKNEVSETDAQPSGAIIDLDVPLSPPPMTNAAPVSTDVQRLEENPAYRLGVMLMQRGNCRDAVKSFETALRTTKEAWQVHSRLATCYGRIGDVKEAKEHAAIAQSLKSK